MTLLDAARWAPSSGNAQPWRFIVTRRGTEAFTRLGECLSSGNRRWALSAPVLMLSIAHIVFEATPSKPARPNEYALHDVGQATAFLTLQAVALGLFVHPMGGFDKAAAAAAFELRDEFVPVAAMAVGYGGDTSVLPEELREQEMTRRRRLPLSQLVLYPNDLDTL